MVYPVAMRRMIDTVIPIMIRADHGLLVIYLLVLVLKVKYMKLLPQVANLYTHQAVTAGD